VCGPGRPGGDTLDSPLAARTHAKRYLPDCRVFQGNIRVGLRHGHKVLNPPLVLKKGKGKRRAAGLPAGSVTTAVGLWGEEGGAPRAKRPDSSLKEELKEAVRPCAQ
jgi:hypothetical protein